MFTIFFSFLFHILLISVAADSIEFHAETEREHSELQYKNIIEYEGRLVINATQYLEDTSLTMTVTDSSLWKVNSKYVKVNCNNGYMVLVSDPNDATPGWSIEDDHLILGNANFFANLNWNLYNLFVGADHTLPSLPFKIFVLSKQAIAGVPRDVPDFKPNATISSTSCAALDPIVSTSSYRQNGPSGLIVNNTAQASLTALSTTDGVSSSLATSTSKSSKNDAQIDRPSLFWFLSLVTFII